MATTNDFFAGTRLVESDVFTPEQVCAGQNRNRIARCIAFSFFATNGESLGKDAQLHWLDACVKIWINNPKKSIWDEGLAARRREEDGIPSAEALLRWFVDNENFCDEVRAAASNRLERIVPRMPDVAISPSGSPTNGVPDVTEP